MIDLVRRKPFRQQCLHLRHLGRFLLPLQGPELAPVASWFPEGKEKTAIGAEGGGQDLPAKALDGNVIALALEPGSVGNHFEGPNIPFAAQKEMVLVGTSQGGPRLKGERRRCIPAVLNGRQDVGGLACVERNPHLLRQPRVVEILAGGPNMGGISILVIHTPARVRTLGKINQALPFPLEIRVVIHCEEIAVVVEVEILAVPQTMGEDLEFAAVRITAQDTARMRIAHPLAFLRQDVGPAIAHAPVELAIICLQNAVKVVVAVPDVGGESMG